MQFESLTKVAHYRTQQALVHSTKELGARLKATGSRIVESHHVHGRRGLGVRFVFISGSLTVEYPPWR